MEPNLKPENNLSASRQKSQNVAGRASSTSFHNAPKRDNEAVLKLTHRLYAAYGDSKMLIPNELLVSVKNSLEQGDPKEELKKRKQQIREKMLGSPRQSMGGAETSRTFIKYASLATIPQSVTPRDLTLSMPKQGLALPQLKQAGSIIQPQPMTSRSKGGSRLRGSQSKLLTAAEIRAEAEKELQEKGATQGLRLKPLQPLKTTRHSRSNTSIRERKKEEGLKLKVDDEDLMQRVPHIELIRLIEDGNKSDHDEYYYCKRLRKQFYEFFGAAFEEIDTERDDYITISSRGIMHFVSREAEFISLAEWKDEVENYKKVHGIPFFKHFRSQKSFVLWKRLVKRTKMVERGAYLKKELFIVDKNLNIHGIDIRKLIYKLNSSDIIGITRDEAMNVDKLTANIKKKQDELQELLLNSEDKIKMLIEKACKNSIFEFNQSTRIFGKEETKKTEGKEEVPYNIFADDSYHPMPYTVEASTKTLFKRLARFIKMIDYMFMQLKLNIIKNSYGNLLSILISPKEVLMKRNSAIFKVSAKLVSDEIVFSPNALEIKKKLKENLAQGKLIICSRPAISDHEAFKLYMSTIKEAEEKEALKVDPLKAVDENEELILQWNEVDKVLDQAFSVLDDYKKELLPYLQIYQDHCKRDFSILEGKPDTMYRNWVEDFEKDRRTVTENLEESRTLGVISIDVSELKKFIIGKTKQSREKMEEIMPMHSDNIVQAMSKKLKEIEDGISPNTTWEINEYVQYKQFLDEHRRKSDDYDEEIRKARVIHGIMSDFGMKINSKDRKKLDNVESKWKNVKERLKTSNEKCEAAEGGMKQILLKMGPDLVTRINEWITQLDNEKYYKEDINAQGILDALNPISAVIVEYQAKAKKIQENQIYMQIVKDEFSELETLKEKHELLQRFWMDQKTWHEKLNIWSTTQIKALNSQEILQCINKMKDAALNAETVCHDEYNITFEFAKSFREKHLEPMIITINVVEDVLRKEVIEDRHWKTIAQKIDCKLSRDDPGLTLSALGKILEAKMKDHKEEAIELWIHDIANQAVQESKLSAELESIRKEWENLHFSTQQVGNKNVLRDTDKMFKSMDEYLINLQKILNSEYADPLRNKAEQLYKNISKIEEILYEMIEIENKMRVADEQPSKEESKKDNTYDEVLKFWRKWFKKGDAAKDTLHARFVVENKVNPDLLEAFQKNNKKMDIIIRDIEKLVESKQLECPRLLFLSNKELMRILADPKKLENVQDCMKVCFTSVSQMLTAEESEETYPAGVVSIEGEEFRPAPAIRAKTKIGENAEKIIMAMAEVMKKELKNRIKKYYTDYLTETKTKAELMINANCSQCILIGEALIFSNNTELVLDEEDDWENNMEQYYDEQRNAYHDIAEQMFGSNASQVTRLSKSALINQFVHFRDIVDFLLSHDVKSCRNFYWQIQLRYYLQPDGVVIVKQLDSAFEYGYEYLGIHSPFPVTPPVERCWISFTTALRNKFWSTVIGPPDHGKLPLCQDLAHMLGKFNLAFTCTSSTSARAVEKLLLAAATLPGWVFFQNANELLYGTLSALAYSMSLIRNSLLEDKVEFFSSTGHLYTMEPKAPHAASNSPAFGIFMLVSPKSSSTMRLADQRVPSTIKMMFRPVAITTADIESSSACWLYCAGFKDGHNLGKKMALLLKSAGEMLQMQGMKWDCGLRTVWSITKLASAYKSEKPDPSLESLIVLNAIHNVFASKLSEEAFLIYEKLEKVIFRGTELRALLANKVITREIVETAAKERHLHYDIDMTPKIIELYEGFLRRTAIILLGDTASGKTKLMHLMAKCYDLINQGAKEANKEAKQGAAISETKIYHYYPKSISIKDIYGGFEANNDWKTGVITGQLESIVRSTSTMEKQLNIIICDGPLDPTWVEPLHSGLDDDRKLCLSNGDILLLNDYTKIVFETDELCNASPTTVSRAAVVYLNKDVAIKPLNIIEGWLPAFAAKSPVHARIIDHVKSQIEALLYQALAERTRIPKLREEKIQLSDNAMTLSFISFFESLFALLHSMIEEKPGEKPDNNLKNLINKVIVFSVSWALGGSINGGKVKKLEDFISETVTNASDKPKEGSCFDSFIQVRGYSEYVSWSELSPAFEYHPELSFTQIAVPTKQFLRYKYLIELLGQRSKHLILFGESGSGKSLIADYALPPMMGEATGAGPVSSPVSPKRHQNFINMAESKAAEASPTGAKQQHNIPKLKGIKVCFTWKTTSGDLQHVIEEKLEKKRRNLYATPSRKRAMIFIDDINLPQGDKYNTIPVLEFLRGIIEEGGYIDTEKKFFKRVVTTSIMGSANPPSGGRKPLPARLLRNMVVLYMNTTSFVELTELFDPVITGFFAEFGSQGAPLKASYLQSILETYEMFNQKLAGNPKRPIYSISYKDIGKLISGFILAKKESIQKQDQFMRLFIHECFRVYGDRIMCDEDRLSFAEQIDKILLKNLNITKYKVAESLNELPLFSNLISSGSDVYAEVKSWTDAQKVFENGWHKFISSPNTLSLHSRKHSSLVFFRAAVEMCLKLSRILTIPRSNAMNICGSSIGGKGLAKVVCFLQNWKIIQMDHNMRDFMENYKKCYKDICEEVDKQGLGSKGLVILAKVGTNDNAETEQIMTDLYQMLSTGELDHMEGICGENVLNITNVRDILHIIMNIPCNLADIRQKMLLYPGFFSEFHIIYQAQWPTAGQAAIAQALMNQIPELKGFPEDIVNAIVKMQDCIAKEVIVSMTDEQRKIIVSPRKHEEMISNLQKIYSLRFKEINKEKLSLENAIKSVELCKQVNEESKNEIVKLKPECDKKKQESDTASTKLKEAETLVNKMRQDILADEDKDKKEGGLKTSKKVPGERQTEGMDKAKQALAEVKGRVRIIDWKQLKNLSEKDTPSQLIALIEGLYILTGEKPSSWDAMQKTMSKTKTDAMLGFDITQISDLMIYDSRILFEEGKQLSAAKQQELENSASIIIEWMAAIFAYFDEIKKALGMPHELEQKKQKLYNEMVQTNKLRKDFESAKAEHTRVSKMRTSLENRCLYLSDLEQQFTSTTSDWHGIKEWKESLQKILNAEKTLIGDCVYSAGIITYLGPFSAFTRERIKKEFIAIIQSMSIALRDNPTISGILCDELTLADLSGKNLLRQEQCIENAFIMNYSPSTPLVIDPENAAIKWLSGKVNIKLSTLHYTEEIQKELTSGHDILINELPEIMPQELYCLADLPKQRTGPSQIMFCGKPTEVPASFSVVFRTEHSNPQFPDNIFSSLSIINFGLDLGGIQDTLILEYGITSGQSEFIDYVLQKEEPLFKDKLETEKQMVHMMNLIDIKKIEMDDQQKICTKLYDTKMHVQDLRKRVNDKRSEQKKEAKEKLAIINNFIKRAASIYAITRSLPSINPTYLIHFDFFKDLFLQTVKSQQETGSHFQTQQQMNIGQMKEHFNKLIDPMTISVMSGIARVMFAADFRLFAYFVAANIAAEIEQISQDEFHIFMYWTNNLINLTSATERKLSGNLEKSQPNPIKLPTKITSITDKSWNLLWYIESVINPSTYKGICEDIYKHMSEWQLWMTSKDPMTTSLPGAVWQAKLTNKPLTKCMLLKLINPQKFIDTIEYIINNVFKPEVAAKFKPIINIPDIFQKEVKSNRPLLIVKDEGEDPTGTILKLSTDPEKLLIKTYSTETLVEIEELLNSIKKQNTDKKEYLFLRDIKPPLAKVIVEIICQLSAMPLDLDYVANDRLRLIISCSTCRLPRYLLTHSSRIALQPPKTMKTKILQDLNQFQQIEASAGPASKEKFTPQFRRLTLSLSILHAMLEKRNIFGSSAWSKPYKITRGEVETAGKLAMWMLDTYENKKPQSEPEGIIEPTPWEPVRRLMDDIVFGGAINEESDKKMLSCLIDMFVCEDAAGGNYSFAEDGIFGIPVKNTYPEIIEHYTTGIPTSSDDYAICNMTKWEVGEGKKTESTNYFKFFQKLIQKKPGAVLYGNATIKATELFEPHYDSLEVLVTKVMEELPEHGFTRDDVSPTLSEGKKGIPYGLNIFILQEMARYNTLIKEIQTTMDKIKEHALNGATMSTELERIYQSLSEGKVPQEFLGYSWTHSLSEWIMTLKKRMEYIRDWLKEGDTKGLWMRAFIYPKGIFNALLMDYSVKFDKKVNELNMKLELCSGTELQEAIESRRNSGAPLGERYLYDLYILGAKYNAETEVLEDLNEEERIKKKFSRLPVVAVSFILDTVEEEGEYMCPMYYVPIARKKLGEYENFITKIPCKTDLKSQYWVLRNVMISCIDPEANA